ncbi:MAG: hypothetical protein Q7J76_01125, partial [Candidatus Brocadiaceae bacterium]|nr:hypothetical protein [Candidatus Brocadiaceae bacterium]
MKNYVVILLGFLLVTPMLGCSKDDTSYPKAGTVYKSKGIGYKNHTVGANGRSPLHTFQQIDDKLRSMSNDDLF